MNDTNKCHVSIECKSDACQDMHSVLPLGNGVFVCFILLKNRILTHDKEFPNQTFLSELTNTSDKE